MITNWVPEHRRFSGMMNRAVKMEYTEVSECLQRVVGEAESSLAPGGDRSGQALHSAEL
jgi:hypothetical protein